MNETNSPTSVHKRKHDRLVSLRRTRNRSVLQIVQTLEICSRENVGAWHRAAAVSPMKRCMPSTHRDAMAVAPRILFDMSARDEVVVDGKDDDDETFLTAMSAMPFHIGMTTTPAAKIGTRIGRTIEAPRSTARGTASHERSASDICNDDLARRIEALVLETENAYEESRSSKRRGRPSDGRAGGTNDESSMTVENAPFGTPSGKTTRVTMGVVTPSPIGGRRAQALEFFGRALFRDAPRSDDVPGLSPVGSSAASLSSEWSIGAGNDDTVPSKRNETWT